MGKIGILTFHYSQNYGGVLQAYALFEYLKSIGYDVEVINYVPSEYKDNALLRTLGIKKRIYLTPIKNLNPIVIMKKILIKLKYNKDIIMKFNMFRDKYMKLSTKVDERNIRKIIVKYNVIIVGSDQIWHSGYHRSCEYFLNYGEIYKGKKISYAADSNSACFDNKNKSFLQDSLDNFDMISVRNKHTLEFVTSITGKKVPVVVDPTLLIDFNNLIDTDSKIIDIEKKYILVYILGKELDGNNKIIIDKIKRKTDNIKVYAIIIPTGNFNLCKYADKVFFNIDPKQWLMLFKNATFVLTDSYHGTIFSLKFRVPFLSYYTEANRTSNFS